MFVGLEGMFSQFFVVERKKGTKIPLLTRFGGGDLMMMTPGPLGWVLVWTLDYSNMAYANCMRNNCDHKAPVLLLERILIKNVMKIDCGMQAGGREVGNKVK